MTTLQQTLDSLAIPAAFARHDQLTDATVLAHLYTWKSTTEPLLNRLDSLDVSSASISELAGLVGVLAPLTTVAPWSSETTRLLASTLLARIPASVPVITHILTQIVKPLFAPTPHPRLHTSTARILPRPADIQDTYVEQPWKRHPGLDEVIHWCLVNTESSAYETMWPLFLPPTMSFLDDYQVPYKTLGVRLVSDMLTRVPPDLLLRAGVDALIFTSLTNSLSHLGDKSTPDFIRYAVPTVLQLIDLTTPSVYPPHGILLPDSEIQDAPATMLTNNLSTLQSESLSIRFSRLSTLLSSSLLGTVITYTSTFLPPVPAGPDPDPFSDREHEDTDSDPIPELITRIPMGQTRSLNPTLVAVAQSLPPVLAKLGIGGARFLKGVIPVLAEWLSTPLPVTAETGGARGEDSPPGARCRIPLSQSSEVSMVDVTLHLASLSSLSVLLHTCSPLIGGWSTTIVDALGRCWVGCLDVENGRRGSTILKESVCVLKKQLKEAAIQVSKVYPDVIKNEYSVLLAFNPTVFEELVGQL